MVHCFDSTRCFSVPGYFTLIDAGTLYAERSGAEQEEGSGLRDGAGSGEMMPICHNEDSPGMRGIFYVPLMLALTRKKLPHIFSTGEKAVTGHGLGALLNAS